MTTTRGSCTSHFLTWQLAPVLVFGGSLFLLFTGTLFSCPPAPVGKAGSTPFVVLGYNELGMHCMNQDFSELCILPPYNNLRAQVLDRRGEDPRIVTSGITVKYSIPGNTVSVPKTNFWTFAPALFNAHLPPNIGLTGNGLAGLMKPSGENDWIATGIPLTPLDDKLNLNPYQLGRIDVQGNGQTLASTVAVVPVSWEINCNLCHNTPGISVATDILRKHDKLHQTRLEASKPVLCGQCHADPALGTTGAPGVKMLSHAMHGAHASRMGMVAQLGNTCYACHPGTQTKCQRDVHLSKGITCINCHGDMAAVGNVNRRPWVDEPTCASCHQARKPTFQFEEPNKLFKNSRGHGGVHCAACHGPQHAITPAVTAPDNAEAILLQGSAGVISKCTVCHNRQPEDAFFHSLDEGRGLDRGARLRRAASATPALAVRPGSAVTPPGKRQDVALQPQVNSVLGTYAITGSERGPIGNRPPTIRFTGTLVTLSPSSVQLTRVFQTGATSKLIIPLAGQIQPNLTPQTLTGTVSIGTSVTTWTFVFTRTATGYHVAATLTMAEIVGRNRVVRPTGRGELLGVK